MTKFELLRIFLMVDHIAALALGQYTAAAIYLSAAIICWHLDRRSA